LKWNALSREIKFKVTEYKLLFNRGGHEEEFEDTKWLIRISISKNRQHNDQKEKFDCMLQKKVVWLHNFTIGKKYETLKQV
jgi:hypothetical protein